MVRLAPVIWVPMPELSPSHEFSTLGAVSRHAGRGNAVPCRNVALVPADRTEPSCKDVCPAPAAGEGRKSRRYSNKYRGEEAQMHGKQSCIQVARGLMRRIGRDKYELTSTAERHAS